MIKKIFTLKKIVVIALLHLIGFGVYYVVKQRTSDPVPLTVEKQDTYSAKEAEVGTVDSEPVESSSSRDEEDSNLAISEDSIAVIEQCLESISGKRFRSKVTSLRDVSVFLTALAGGSVEELIEYDVYHLEKTDGQKLRVRLYLDSTKGGLPEPRMQLFSEDKEGLPVLEKIPLEHHRNPSPDTISDYLSKGKTVFRETKRIEEYLGGASSEIIEQNGKITYLHLVHPASSLGCAFNENEKAIICKCGQ